MISGRRNIVFLGTAFFFLFAAYNTAQNLVTTVLPDGLGFYSLCIVYAAVCIVKPFAPSIVVKLTATKAMFGG